MRGPPGSVLGHDVAPRVDTEGLGGSGTRNINNGKGALEQQEAMVGAASEVQTNDVTPRVDTEGLSG